MKKLLVLVMLTLFGLQIVTIDVHASSTMDAEISQFIQEYSLVEHTWVEARVHSSERLYSIDNQIIGYLFRVYQKNIQQGYIIYLFDSGITEAKFTGTDRALDIKGKVYYITPSGFLSKKQVDEYYDVLLYNSQISTTLTASGSGEKITQLEYDENDLLEDYSHNDVTFTITTSHVPDLSSNVSSYYISMVSKVWIENVPSYLNGLDGIYGSCAPTSGAMLIAYYDNELWNNLSTLEGIWAGQYFPLFHEDDEDLVNDLIFVMADYFRTCIDMDGDLSSSANCVGSSPVEIAYGLSRYLDLHWHPAFEGILRYFSTDYDDYTSLILLGNPAIVNMFYHPTYGNHSVLAMGFYNAYMSPSGIIIYDNWEHGEVWLSYSVVSYYEFIYDI